MMKTLRMVDMGMKNFHNREGISDYRDE